jgi:hypothetical protein
MTPVTQSEYHSRATLRGLWKQYFEYGVYKVRVIQKRGAVPSWRHLVPVTFVLGSVGSVLASVVTGSPLWAGLVLGAYLLANLGASALVAAREGWRYLPILPLAFSIIHVAYGCGFLVGLIRFGLLGRLWRQASA